MYTLAAMIHKPSTVSEWLAVISVGIISLANIFFCLMSGFDIHIIVSLLGLTFVGAFLFNKNIYSELLLVWAISQLIIVIFPMRNEFFNLSQLINLEVGVTFNARSAQWLHVGIGLPGIFFTALAIKVKMDSIFGTKIRLIPFKNDSVLSEFLPAEAIIEKRIKLGEETSWYVVRFTDSSAVFCALIRGKDSYLIRPGKKQIVEFWKVEDPEWILSSDTIDRKLLRKPGWAVVM
jgi:hypothetical protein